jgi:hypothetical protein
MEDFEGNPFLLSGIQKGVTPNKFAIMLVRKLQGKDFLVLNIIEPLGKVDENKIAASKEFVDNLKSKLGTM